MDTREGALLEERWMKKPTFSFKHSFWYLREIALEYVTTGIDLKGSKPYDFNTGEGKV